MATAFGDYVLGLYAAIYKRVPDRAGYDFWTKNSDLHTVAAAFAGNAQWKIDFPSTLSDADYVDQIYWNMLKVSGDVAGRAYWTDLIVRKVESRTDMVADFVKAVLDFSPINSTASGTDLTNAINAAAILNYKVTFGNYWLNSAKATAPGIDMIDSALYKESVTLLSSVTDSASLAAAKASIDNSVIVLTTTTDNVLGTSLSDTIVGDFTLGANTLTLNISDQINGGAGIDTLKLYGPASTAALPLAITNVEILEFVNPTLAAGAVLDTTGIAGLTKVQIDQANTDTASSTFLPIIKTGNGVTLQLATTKDTTAVSHSWQPSSTDSSLNLILNGFGRAVDSNAVLALSGATATSLNISSTGAFNAISLTNTSTVTTDTITGDKDLRLTQTAGTALKSMDASKATGNLTLDISAGVTNSGFSFIGGAGNDKLILAANELTTLSSGSQLDGGAGLYDVLQINDIAFTPALYTALNAVKGFDWLTLAGNKVTADVSQLTGFKNIGIGNSAATATITGGSSTNNYIIDNSKAHGVLAIANQTGQATQSVALDNSSGLNVTSSALNLTGTNQPTLTSTGASTKANGINGLVSLGVPDGSTVTVLGDTDLSITKITTNTAVKVDAAKFTGKLALGGTDQADTLIGGSGNDTLDGGLGIDLLSGGDGADSFVAKATVATGAGDIVADFHSGTDSIILSKTDFAALASSVGSGFSSTTDFAVRPGGAATLATDRIIFDSTSKKLYYDSDGSGSAAAVMILDLTGQSLVASDFVVVA